MKKTIVLVGLMGIFCGQIGLSQESRAWSELDPITVLARRVASNSGANASSVGLISKEELERRQITRLLDAFEVMPGTQALSTAGLTGNTGTLIIRGLPTNYQQLVVDGVRVADATNGNGNFLANASLAGVTGLEVLRGPQGVLYGSGAGGGVVGFETRVGSGMPRQVFFGEGGSFSSARYGLRSEGEAGDFAYGVEVGWEETANDTDASLPIHDYEQRSANMALQWKVRDDLRVKLSYRGSDNRLVTRSIGAFGPQDSDIETETSLWALNVFYDALPWWKSRVTAGSYQESYDADFGGFPFWIDYDRWTFVWANEWEVTDEVTVLGGLEGGWADFANATGRAVDFGTVGGYAGVEYRPIEAVLFEASGRLDEHEEFGSESAWSAGASYEWKEQGTKLHARVSEGYRHPTLLDSEFFQGAFSTQLANPDLESEEILGSEIGLRQRVGEHEFGVNFYHQQLSNAITTESVVQADGSRASRRVNRPGESDVSGFEMSAAGQFFDKKVRYRLAWTEQRKEEILDVPDRLVGFDVSYNGGAWLAGAGVSYVDGAAYLASGNPQTDDRAVVRLYGEYRINEMITVYGRVENLFDEQYELFPDTFGPGSEVEGPGRAFYLGARITW